MSLRTRAFTDEPMDSFQRLEEICRAMSVPTFYPHSVSSIQRTDTHISTVFLTGRWVYKLKKPVDFGFLDFRTLEARRHYCLQEVLLNQRLSRDVYEEVVGIRRDDDGSFSLGADGEVVEYAVKMRQLSEKMSLASLLERNRVSSRKMIRLGAHLASFFDRSARSPDIDRFGSPSAVQYNMEENFRQTESFAGSFLQGEPWEFLRQVSRTFFEHHKEMFALRVREGRIRDGHGDLRADHVYFFRGIQIIDCIEFNDRFRYGDAVADLAFLHMDLEHRGHASQSRIFLEAYAREAKDPQVYALLDFYAAYRAMVRVKVACLRSTEVTEEQRGPLRKDADTYLWQAYRYAFQFARPTLWILCGLPASGKSFLALKLSEILHLPVFQSDRVRKESGGEARIEAGVVPYGGGIYRAELRQRVYGQLLASAQEQLKGGRSVVLDASFSRRKWREEAARLARDLDTNLVFVECFCEEETLRRRLEQREKDPGLSDARLMHLPAMVRDFEPLTEVSPLQHDRVRTEGDPDRVFVETISGGYFLKCAQVGELLQGAGSDLNG